MSAVEQPEQATLHILDVSRYQGRIDWDAVAACGLVDGVMLRAVSTNPRFGGVYLDPEFEYNYAGCRRVGLPVGAYYYTYAQTPAQADAELALLRQTLAGKTLELPVAVDVEDACLAALTPAELSRLVARAAETVEEWGPVRDGLHLRPLRGHRAGDGRAARL